MTLLHPSPMSKIVLTSILLTMLLQCTSEPTPVEPPAEGDQKVQTAPSATLVPAEAYDGVYVFDEARYKSEQLKHPQNVFSGLDQANINRMLQVFKPYQVEMQQGAVVARFAQQEVKGSIVSFPSHNGQTVLQVQPELNADGALANAKLIIESDGLVLDPGQKETDKMYFRKQQP